jgi:2-amino-4-hydroxy-6-hydroxymethyldihydropteridine diphosphokinase
VSEERPALAVTAYVGIGSNMGEPLSNCLQAIDLIDDMAGCRVTGVSHFYRTEPVGADSQDWYVNGAVAVETALAPDVLLRSFLSIEADMGRVRRRKWESRIIDIDILLYGNEIIEAGELMIPHPLMHQRRFVLMPLGDLNPGLIHPVLKKSIAELMEDLTPEGQAVVVLSET